MSPRPETRSGGVCGVGSTVNVQSKPMLGLGRSSEHLRLAAMLTRLTGLNGTDAVWPHHLVVFVLYDVAVPDELPGRVVENRAVN